MKKIAFALAIMAILCACGKESTPSSRVRISINASASEDTKVVYDKVQVDGTSKYRPSWVADDRIGVSVAGMAENLNIEFTKEAEGNFFSGEVVPWTGEKDIYVVHPYTDGLGLQSSSVVLDRAHTTIEEGADNYSHCMLFGLASGCTPENIGVKMKQPFAIVKMTISDVPVGAKVIKVGVQADKANVLAQSATLELASNSFTSPTYTTALQADVTGTSYGSVTHVNLGIIPTFGEAVLTFEVVLSTGQNYVKKLSKARALAGGTVYTVNFSIGTLDTYLDFGPGVMFDDVVWAPVNCGYSLPSGADGVGHPMGLLYQWGRKDGFGYNNTFIDLYGNVIQSESSRLPVGSKGAAVGDYTAPDPQYVYNNWNPSSVGFALWSEEKTEYDPCPQGWRVPTVEEAQSLVKYQAWSADYGFYCYKDASKTGQYLCLPHAGFYPGSRTANYRYGSSGGLSTRYLTTTVPSGTEKVSLINGRSSLGMCGESPVSAFALRCVLASRPTSGDASTTIDFPNEENIIDF